MVPAIENFLFQSFSNRWHCEQYNTYKTRKICIILTAELRKMLRFWQKQNKHNLRVLASFCRSGHTLRGKPPGIARTLEHRLLGMQFIFMNYV